YVIHLAGDPHPLPELERPAIAHLQTARHAGMPCMPGRPAHRLVQHQRGDATMDHPCPALEPLGHLVLRNGPVGPWLEFQLQSVSIEWPASEAVAIEVNLHPTQPRQFQVPAMCSEPRLPDV